MIILGIVAYYLFAFAVIATTVRLVLRQNLRRANAMYDRAAEKILESMNAAPPLPPYTPPPPADEFEDEWDDDEFDGNEVPTKDEPDLSAPDLQPITPLLRRVAQQYRDKPGAREHLVLSLTRALDESSPG